MKIASLLSIFFISLSAEIVVNLPYGACTIEDPIVESIILSPPYQRLHGINQYGISFFNHVKDDYKRFDHCVGVYWLLKKADAPYLEQVSGLLHDASHTAFSHFGDYFFSSHGQDSWQDIHHNEFLEKIGLKELIEKNGLKLHEIYHKNKHFTALDKPLPDLCADRLEYNLQGAYKHGLITHEELLALFEDVKYQDSVWSFSKIELAQKLSLSSIFMMENIWSCPTSHLSNLVLCKIVAEAVSKNILNLDMVMFQKDEDIWQTLLSTDDAYIQKGINLLSKLKDYVIDVKRYSYSYKCRAIDPYIRTDEGLKRLTDVSNSYKEAFQKAQLKASTGFFFDICDEALGDYSPYLSDLQDLEIRAQ